MSKYKEKYHLLQSCYNELYDHMLDIQDTNEHYQEDLHYLEAFLEWKNLMDEFIYFKKNAYEKYDNNLPFSTLTLQ